ncbi:DUF3263 domain-containing protein [Naasia sp. SYSU D00948]|uniref:DUF3263 domain-containing protein n=1 Tax=Naasia sp. SYSU D00948 TaxID=2817379 RepID=UPI001B30CB77|nr:DUF3263 domain-containing protein [Naasia sp. SYSU D00948]
MDPVPSDRSEAGGRLDDREMAILAFERTWWAHRGAKEEAIREEFGISAARYYQLLGALIDSPAALVHDPMLVKRLQRLRDARVARRAARRSLRRAP